MSGRLTAPDRLARLLAVIPYVAGRGGVPLDEVAARFSYPRNELVADLTEVVGFVGVDPFTPDTMIEVVVDDEQVHIVYGKWFAKPMRLEPGEALRLFAAGRALLASTGEEDGPLLRGLTKLGAALGAGGDAPVDIVLGSVEERWLAVLRTAVAEHRCVHLDYYSYGSDARRERVIEPHRFFADDGPWYISGFCRLTQGNRVFRVDRIHSARLLDETFVPPDETAAAVLDPAAATLRATLDLSPQAQWVIDHYPHESVEMLPSGWQRVTLPVTAAAWLERLLLRLGPDAQVVSIPNSLGHDPCRDAARRILARYQASGPRDDRAGHPHEGEPRDRIERTSP